MLTQKKIFINSEDIYDVIIYDNNRFPNHDMEKVWAMYVKYLIFYSNLSEGSFTCLKPSFIPFTSMKAFYWLDEMICAAVNLVILNESFYESKSNLLKDNDLLLKVCHSIQKIDTSSSDLKKHQNHIIKSRNWKLIHYYTTHCSSDLNLVLIYMYAPMIYMYRKK